MDSLLREMALGIAQVRYWDLGKEYRRMLARMEREYPVAVPEDGDLVLCQCPYADDFMIDQESEQIARAWFDFCQEHDGWSFLVFDPCDFRKACNDEIEPLAF
ncbi:MAG: hypothetical protein E4G89_00075 [Methanothrix sp.]|nr:MAG: hypothetical protein E4G89_00075 [Methanothrix sp.]